MLRKRLDEIVGVALAFGILTGLPIAIFAFQHNSAIQRSPQGDAVVVIAGRNDGKEGQEGIWIIEDSNVPIHKEEDGIPVIHVKHGQRVLFRVTSKDVLHGFAIEEYGIDALVHPGVFEEVVFVADKQGEFKIQCSLFCGLGHHGMVAELIVEE